MLEFKFDTQLLIEGHDLDEDAINDYITENFKGDCLLAARSTISWSRTWSGRSRACTGEEPMTRGAGYFIGSEVNRKGVSSTVWSYDH